MRRSSFLLVGLIASLAGQARAEPTLQLYVQGASYDNQTHTWAINTTDAQSINLWVLVNPPKGSTINDVSIIIAGASSANLQSTIVGTNLGASGYKVPGGTTAFKDSFFSGNAPPATPTLFGLGTTPPSQQPHGIYKAGTAWQQYSLGNFSSGSLVKIADMTDDENPGSKNGYIGVYSISFTASTLPTWINIDAAITYSTTDKKGKVTTSTDFAPYSHTARGTLLQGGGPPKPPGAVPEPSSLAIAGLGVLGLVGYGLRRRSNP